MGPVRFEADILVKALMADNDGVLFSSPFPIEFQRTNQAEKYRRILEENDLIKKIDLAVHTLEDVLDKSHFQECIKELESVINSTNDQTLSSELIKTLLQSAKKHYEEKSFHLASAIYTLLLVTDTLNSHHWYCLGMSEQAQGLYVAANTAYGFAFDLDPSNFHSLLFAAECLIQEDNLYDAERKLECVKEQFITELNQEKHFQDLFLTLQQMITDQSKV